MLKRKGITYDEYVRQTQEADARRAAKAEPSESVALPVNMHHANAFQITFSVKSVATLLIYESDVSGVISRCARHADGREIAVCALCERSRVILLEAT